MYQNTMPISQQKWYDSAHASLCVLGVYLRQIGFFDPVEQRVHLQQKVLKYTAVQKLEMLFVGLLAGIKAVSRTATTVRIDKALTAAFGLPGCAELFGRYSSTRQLLFNKEILVLYLDLSPLSASKKAEGSERDYLGRSRSKTGRKLVRVRAAASGEIVWETVISAGTVESLPVLQEAIQAAERLLDLGETAKRCSSSEHAPGSAWIVAGEAKR